MFNFTIDELQVVISGKIDRIDQEGDSLSVIDYKTSKNKEKAKGNLQLALYTEALKRDAVEDVKGDPGTTILHFLRHYEDPLESHTFTSDDLNKELEKVSKVAEGIRKNEFQTKPGDFNCQNCDYRQFLCPAWEED
jgi:ATP-dependent helicase/DNAse subunit B